MGPARACRSHAHAWSTRRITHVGLPVDCRRTTRVAPICCTEERFTPGSQVTWMLHSCHRRIVMAGKHFIDIPGVNMSDHNQRIRSRDAGLRRVRQLTMALGAGGVVMAGGFSVLAERAYSGQRAVVAPVATDPSSTDPALDPAARVVPATDPATGTLAPPLTAAPVPAAPVPVAPVTTAPLAADPVVAPSPSIAAVAPPAVTSAAPIATQPAKTAATPPPTTVKPRVVTPPTTAPAAPKPRASKPRPAPVVTGGS